MSLSIEQLQAQLQQAREYIVSLEQRNKELNGIVEELSINPNFKVRTRVAGFIHALKAICDKRKSSSDSYIYLIAIDIAGMGWSNNYRGELGTNEAMTSLMENIRKNVRKNDHILLSDGQLNSGDEFLLWVNTFLDSPEELESLCIRLDYLAKQHGFKGAYCGIEKVPNNVSTREELVDLADKAMLKVYNVKKALKAKEE